MASVPSRPSTVEPPPMKVLVCGSRNWPDRGAVVDRVGELPDGSIVIAGEATGPDQWARCAAVERGLFVAEVPVRSEHWRRHGKAAGHRRNRAMLDLGVDLVIAFYNDSAGTKGTIEEARRRGVTTEVHHAA